MLSKREEVERGKFLSFLLRHGLKESGLAFDQAGWVPVTQLLEKLRWPKQDLLQIVENNNKKRYEFSPNGEKIRACQGHTVEVNLELPKVAPPEFLFHGTAQENLASILANGLEKRARHAVHLSQDLATAKSVGSRHSKNVVILKVLARALHVQKGVEFEKSTNGVWLVEHVPPEFIQV